MSNKKLAGSPCKMPGDHDGPTTQWLILQHGERARTHSIVLCEHHADNYTFAEVFDRSEPAYYPQGQQMHITHLKTTPESAPFKKKVVED